MHVRCQRGAHFHNGHVFAFAREKIRSLASHQASAKHQHPLPHFLSRQDLFRRNASGIPGKRGHNGLTARSHHEHIRAQYGHVLGPHFPIQVHFHSRIGQFPFKPGSNPRQNILVRR